VRGEIVREEPEKVAERLFGLFFNEQNHIYGNLFSALGAAFTNLSLAQFIAKAIGHAFDTFGKMWAERRNYLGAEPIAYEFIEDEFKRVQSITEEIRKSPGIAPTKVPEFINRMNELHQKMQKFLKTR